MFAGVFAAVALAVAPSHIAFAADRLPASMGEIYRVAANGAITNLTHSPASEVQATAAPDGKWIAFVRVRLSNVQIYVVGSTGRGLHAVSPPLSSFALGGGGVDSIAWSPDSERLAVVRYVDNRTILYVGGRRGGWRAVAHGASGQPAAWSSDGSKLAFPTSTGLIRVVTASGRSLWRAGGLGTPAWSQSGLLAVHANSTTIAVFDARGTQRASFAGSAFAWRGDVLASDRSGTLELRTRGAGAPTLRVRLVARARPDDPARIEWDGATRIRLFDNQAVGYDLARHRRFALPAGLTAYDGTVSAAGVAAWWRYRGGEVELVRDGRVVQTRPSCHDDPPFDRIQFLGRTNVLVYESSCLVPSADLYSIAPDGSGLARLTSTPQHEFDPALSPDGSRVAYVRQLLADRCDGCAQSLWVTSPAKQLTSPSENDPAPFDDSPSWSPDGTLLVFSQSGPDSPFALLTVPVAGGTPTPLGIAGQRPVWGPKLIAFEVDGLPPKLETYDPVTHEIEVVATTKGRDPLALAWSQDGRLAYLASNGKERWISIVGGPSFDVSKLLPKDSFATGLAWSPDGSRFAIVSKDANGLGEVWTVGVDGKDLRQVTRDLDVVGNLSWR